MEQYYRLDSAIHFNDGFACSSLFLCVLNLFLVYNDAENLFHLFHFRFHEHWRFVLQRLAFLSAFVIYLESENLVTRDEVAHILGSRYQFVCHVP